MKRVIVAFSGGIDSTFLLFTAVRILGAENVFAVTGVSPTYLEAEIEEAKDLADFIGVQWRKIDTLEMEDPRFTANPEDRCYHCKRELFLILNELASGRSIDYVLDGTNDDDLSDYRPGCKAAAELGIRSPLADCELTKSDIRELAAEAALPNWDKPSMACLASRIPYGTEITAKRLSQVADGEDVLRRMGFKEIRLRWHDEIARIELSKQDMPKALLQRQEIVESLKRLGFAYICLDIEGIRSGSMNEALGKT